ncbi:glycoside hydrolase family protein [Pantoea agglomerans]|uniref:glycoside hydrolase family protein n=1 Tax=Enterobacter agglomerans TaxID=549 RepID=UPI000907A569|nr:hypothetical protein [Pantoea agglomerans]
MQARRCSYTVQECDTLLRADLKPVQADVDSLVTVTYSDYLHAAIHSFAYNVDTKAFARPVLLKKYKAGDTTGACDELHRRFFAGGRKRKGLMNRRESECALCLAEQSDDLKQSKVGCRYHH